MTPPCVFWDVSVFRVLWFSSAVFCPDRLPRSSLVCSTVSPNLSFLKEAEGGGWSRWESLLLAFLDIYLSNRIVPRRPSSRIMYIAVELPLLVYSRIDLQMLRFRPGSNVQKGLCMTR